MAQSHEVLNHVTLTQAVNEKKDPLSFVKNMVFGKNVTVPTRHIEVSVIRRGRRIAPLVKRDGAAVMTKGRTDEFYPIMPAHIRTKRPMTPSDLLEKRRAGGVIHLNGDQGEAIRQYMADELSFQMDDHTNTEEYLACLALRGSYTYSGADEVELSVDFRRPTAHNVTLSGANLWSATTTASPDADIQAASDLTEAETGLVVTDAIMAPDAATAFFKVDRVMTLLDTRRLITGQLDITQPIQQNGARYLGMLSSGVRLWVYNRSVILPDNSTEQLIRANYVEFIANSPQADFVTYYGAIEDMKAIGAGRVLRSQRFSKSWEEEDPSARMLLVESNPLPVMRRPGATVSMKVL